MKSYLFESAEHQPYQPRVCLRCGAPVGDRWRFCPACLAALTPEERGRLTRRDRYRRLREQNLCISCGGEDAQTLAGRALCGECQRKQSIRDRRLWHGKLLQNDCAKSLIELAREGEIVKYRLTMINDEKKKALLDCETELYEPFGKFYHFDEAEGIYTAIDNRDGHAYTEEFSTKLGVTHWFGGGSVVNLQGERVRNPIEAALAEKVMGVLCR